MKNTGLKIAISCFAGATLGALVALQFSPWFWWLGLMVGFAVGYLSYEFKVVIQAIKKAWQATTNWRPNWPKIGMILFGVGTSLIITLYFLMLIIITILPPANQTASFSLALSILIWFGVMVIRIITALIYNNSGDFAFGAHYYKDNPELNKLIRKKNLKDLF